MKNLKILLFMCLFVFFINGCAEGVSRTNENLNYQNYNQRVPVENTSNCPCNRNINQNFSNCNCNCNQNNVQVQVSNCSHKLCCCSNPNMRCRIPRKFINTLGMEFVYIPPGEFMMGSPKTEKNRDETERLHKVIISKGFYMQTTEVTQGQWKRIMGYNPSHFNNCGDSCPVENVTWNEVQEFIRRLNKREHTNAYRLPTESEWEYVCKTGSSSPIESGSLVVPGCDSCGCSQVLNRIGWYFGNSNHVTHPVAMKEPNLYGIYDMHGNVWEWCSDWQAEYPQEPVVVDPKGPPTGNAKIRRGGAWNHYAMFARCSYRSWASPLNRYPDTGFRLVRDVDASICNKNENTNLNSQVRKAVKKIVKKECKECKELEFPIIFFNLNSSKIRPDMEPVLDEVADLIKRYNLPVELDGYTCNLASERYNLGLGLRRAKAVRKALIERGIPADMIRIRSYGEAYPLYPNTTEATRRLNRRVEIHFIKQ